MKRSVGVWWAGLLMASALAACAQPPTPSPSLAAMAPTVASVAPATPTLVASSSPSDVPSAVTSPPTTPPGERVVGGEVVIHERPGVVRSPSITAGRASAIVQKEIAAGPAGMANRTGVPRWALLGASLVPKWTLVAASFSPALLDVINPGGGPSFLSAKPVAAWVVVLRGEGSDGEYPGEYTVLGVVADRTARPLRVDVWWPGWG